MKLCLWFKGLNMGYGANARTRTVILVLAESQTALECLLVMAHAFMAPGLSFQKSFISYIISIYQISCTFLSCLTIIKLA